MGERERAVGVGEKLMLVDTHCHLYYDSFDEDRDSVMTRAAELGVTRIIIPATDFDSGAAGIALADRYPGVYASVGIHPNDSKTFHPDQIAAFEAQSKHPKVVAIGEIGLDYHWDFSPKSAQWAAFEAQLALAQTVDLPVIIHNREASEDVIQILKTWVNGLTGRLRDQPGVLHSFSAPRSIADQALELGFYFGFTGPITYKNADELRSIAAILPTDRVLVETDAPYLTPIPHRGKRNEPGYTRLVAERLAAVRTVSLEQIAAQTTSNAERLFRLPVG
jgi:TatD DNase family protein